MDLGALTTERLTDTVYSILRDRILSGAFRPGDKLNVDQLAQQLNISQTPIKGALALLAAEGLVQIQPRRGTFVTEIAQNELAEVSAIRVALETLAAETLLDHVSESDLAALAEIAQQIEDAPNVDIHFRKNAEFHQRLVELSGNRKLAEMYRQLHAHIHIALVHSRSTTWKGRSSAEAQEHQAILKAIQDRDKTALKEAITAHLRRGGESLLSEIQTQAHIKRA